MATETRNAKGDQMVTVVEFTDGKFSGCWTEETTEVARESVNRLKLSGEGKTYSIEDRFGAVAEVIRK